MKKLFGTVLYGNIYLFTFKFLFILFKMDFKTKF